MQLTAFSFASWCIVSLKCILFLNGRIMSSSIFPDKKLKFYFWHSKLVLRFLLFSDFYSIVCLPFLSPFITPARTTTPIRTLCFLSLCTFPPHVPHPATLSPHKTHFPVVSHATFVKEHEHIRQVNFHFTFSLLSCFLAQVAPYITNHAHIFHRQLASKTIFGPPGDFIPPDLWYQDVQEQCVFKP